jgi:hypothetical protein
MSEKPPLPAPLPDRNVERSLATLAEQRMLAPARQGGYELQLVGATVLPQRQTITRTKHGTWLFVDHAEDPTTKQYGGLLPIPAEQLDRLSELDRCGVSPQLVWIGHQLPRDYVESEPLPQLVPVPRDLREKDERLQLRLTRATDLFIKGTATILTGAALTPIAVAATVVGAIGLDPIVFGGVKHPELPLVEWCVLAQWEWE